MDKKFTLIGVLCIIIAIVLGFQSYQQEQKAIKYRKDHPELFPATPAATAGTAGTSNAAAPATAAASSTVAASTATATATPASSTASATTAPATPTNGTVTGLTPAAVVAPTTPALTYELNNDYIDVTLTEDGGAIKSVTLKKIPARLHNKDPLIFNAGAPHPALSLSVPDPARANDGTYWSWTGSSATAVMGNAGVPPLPLLGRCTLDESLSTPTSKTFRGKTVDGLVITRTYTLSSGNEDAYLIHHTTTIDNRGENPAPLTRLFVNAGMAPPPVPESSSIALMYLNFAYYNGTAAGFVTVSEFQASPSHIFGLIAARPKQKDYVYATHPTPDIQWVSVKDAFFATVLTPKGVLGSGFYVRGVEFNQDGALETTVSGDVEFNLGTLAPGAEKKLELNYYVGPKEYVRLDKMGGGQDRIMQFPGWLSGFCDMLLLALIGIHKAISPLSPEWAWGWTIIVFTIIIKGVTWPLTAIQVRSGKRMQQIQGPMKALKEKYKDNPQKFQTEMLALYKKHKINPAAGCLPLLITFPIFIAFNYMLRTAAEMRFQSFFWIHDLSMPDTIAHIGGFAVNLLPLIMTATMMLQMHLTPSPSADPAQMRIMKFLPLLFLAGFYTMPSGMILYWTCQNLFTILQQYLTNRRKDDPAAAVLEVVEDRPKTRRH